MQPIAGRNELGHQANGVAAFDWMQAQIIPTWNLDCQKPAVIAQLEGGIESLLAGGGRKGRSHSISLILLAVEQIEGA